MKRSYINSFKRFSFHPTTWVGTSSTIYFDKRYNNNKIVLGEQTRINDFCELIVGYNENLIIKDHTNCNSGCKFMGDVTIERYVLISAKIFVSSGNHYMDTHPTWLIKEQDREVLSNEEGLRNHASHVHIEEDSWLGYGSFIKPGLYLGRGCVISDYAMVTKDVPPYTVISGTPGKEVEKRFDFNPPVSIDSTNDEHQPYFYRGFNHIRAEISAEHGLKCIDPSIVTLKKLSSDEISLTLEGYNPANSLTLALTIANNEFTEIEIPAGEFSKEVVLRNQEAPQDAQDSDIYNTLNQYMKESYTCLTIKPSQRNWFLRKVSIKEKS